jgi:hypothetical protein
MDPGIAAELHEGWLARAAFAREAAPPTDDAGLRMDRIDRFYRCTACDWKAGITTKKAKDAEAEATITGWCGTRLEVRYNHLGVPYAGCPACHPEYKHPTVNDLYYGTSRR